MTLIRLDTQAEEVKHPAGDLDLQNITVWLGKVMLKFTISTGPTIHSKSSPDHV